VISIKYLITEEPDNIQKYLIYRSTQISESLITMRITYLDIYSKSKVNRGFGSAA